MHSGNTINTLISSNNIRSYFLIISISLLFALSIMIHSDAKAQNGNIWTFGYHNGIDFNTYPPTVLKPEPLIESPNSCASICDSSGKLLFYTDGKKVYSKNNIIYNNGNNINGESVFNQSALILPSGSNPDEYFLITINDAGKNEKGIYYSYISTKNQIVNTKNKVLAKGSFLNLTTIRHNNNTDYWIIAKKFSDTFYIFRLSGNIISKPNIFVFSKPVVNEPHKPYYSFLNPSFDGKLIVESCFYESQKRNHSDYASYLIFYDFNAATGQLQNKRIILQSFQKEKGYPLHMYNQSAFSPNDSLIYITDIAVYPRTAPLIQLNRYSLEKVEINGSNKMEPFTAIKTGPDGKIYLSYTNQPFLAVILKPDINGNNCNLRDNYLKISDKSFNRFAFPNVYFKPVGVNFSFINNCDSTVSLINTSDTSFFSRFTWFLSNGDTVSSFNCRYKFGKSGWHNIKLKAQTSWGYSQWYSNALLLSNKPFANFSIDSNIACQWNEVKFNDLSSAEIHNQSGGSKCLWYFGDGSGSAEKNPVHIYSGNGKFSVTLIYSNGFCADTLIKKDLIEVLEAAKPGFNLNHKNYCSPFNLQVFDDTRGQVSNYHYDFGDGNSSNLSSPTHFYSLPGNYHIRQLVYSPNGCVTSANTVLHLRKGFSQTEQIDLLNASVDYKNQIQVNWEKHPDAFSYRIFRSENNNSFYTVKNASEENFTDKICYPSSVIYRYKLIAYDSCGRESAVSNTVNTILLTAESNGNDFSIIKWNDAEGWDKGVKEYILEYKDESGIFKPLVSTEKNEVKDYDFFQENLQLEKCYRVSAVANGGSHQQRISNEVCLPYESFIFVPNAFSPNGDGVNDTFTIVGMCIKSVRIEIYNYWGETIFSSNEIQKVWDGNYLGKEVPTGPYIYHISATTAKDEFFTYEGVVNLIR